jgi:hypothetical protein
MFRVELEDGPVDQVLGWGLTHCGVGRVICGFPVFPDDVFVYFVDDDRVRQLRLSGDVPAWVVKEFHRGGWDDSVVEVSLGGRVSDAISKVFQPIVLSIPFSSLYPMLSVTFGLEAPSTVLRPVVSFLGTKCCRPWDILLPHVAVFLRPGLRSMVTAVSDQPTVGALGSEGNDVDVVMSLFADAADNFNWEFPEASSIFTDVTPGASSVISPGPSPRGRRIVDDDSDGEVPRKAPRLLVLENEEESEEMINGVETLEVSQEGSEVVGSDEGPKTPSFDGS